MFHSKWMRQWYCFAIAGASIGLQLCRADDFYVTIGGGFEPSSNQASLEANVRFFQDVLRAKAGPIRQHSIFFADGFDKKADVQIELSDDTITKSERLLVQLRRLPASNIAYRDHVLSGIEEASKPRLIRSRIEQIAKIAKSGDRVVIYVTAHGGKGNDKEPFNTTIYCWNKSTITAREFSGWLDQFSPEVKVILVMAQCYCGGFSYTIFSGGDAERGLSKHNRIGFFAQQHNLQAAGCRPDVKNDEEFSSYFWGALIGTSRSGKPMSDADLNRNGQISWDEAYAHAVITSETIDIPMRSSDVLLRTYSKIPMYTLYSNRKPPSRNEDLESIAASERDEGDKHECNANPSLLCMSNTIEELVDKATPIDAKMVEKLCDSLDIAMDMRAEELAGLLGRRIGPGFGGPGFGGFGSGGSGPRQGRRSSGRRELLAEIEQRWPELAEDDWRKSPLLGNDQQESFLAEVEKMSSFEAYERRKKELEEITGKSKIAEMQRIKTRRLLETLESIALANNLEQTASKDIVDHYRRMLLVEQSNIGLRK